MKILITGASGFIGGRCAERLLESKEHSVRITGRRAPSNARLKEAEFLPADLTKIDQLDQLTRGIDAIVHCAGLAGTWGPFEKFYEANVLATENLIAAAKKNGVKRLINVSSPSVYFAFRDQFDLKETDLPAKFSNAYAETKWEAEKRVSQAHDAAFATVSLRPRSVIGAGDQNVLPRLIRLQKARRLFQVGSGDNLVDITTVDNLIDAIELCLVAPIEVMGETYNITNGKPVRFGDFVDLVLRESGLPTKRKHLPYPLVAGLARANEWIQTLLRVKDEPTLLPISIGILAFSMTLDIRKAREKLGYKPRLTTADGVKEFASLSQTRS